VKTALSTDPTPKLRRISSVVRALDVLADAWSFLVLREAFFGVRRFDGFRRNLGAARSVLTERLDRLVTEGVLARVAYQQRPERHEYRLTTAGRDFYPAIVALMAWGDRWLCIEDQPPLLLLRRDGSVPRNLRVVCAVCGNTIEPHAVTMLDGPGAGVEARPHPGARQRPPDPGLFARGRPCSVARALAVIGDRWSFRILRDVFLRVRRFDDLQESLGIARNVLTDRLDALVDAGVLTRQPYGSRADRHDYVLTAMGLDLYPTFLLMMAWGDRWRAPPPGPPLVLMHSHLPHRVAPLLVDADDGSPVTAAETAYRMRYAYSPPG